jgi:2-keto-4-pentenoate hydratase/2-oxohepta-3-ene-1,7-dioic acid hydratase in catechol pathway
MKLGRLGEVGSEIPVLFDEDVVRDLRSVTADIDGQFWASRGPARVRTALAEGALPVLEDAHSNRVGAPIARPGKVVCIGLNYRDHAQETGAALPDEPVIFMKDPYTVVGPFDQIRIPRKSTKTDWEVELAVVIGEELRYAATPDIAMSAIAGYAISHDVSEREFQLERGGTWDKGKSCETFNPLGPWLVTPDEVENPQALNLQLWVNGSLRQDGSTANMIFPIAEILRYVSQFMTLYPGDIVNTGTPAGVALGLPNTPFLRAGDTVDLQISGLGHARQELVNA